MPPMPPCPGAEDLSGAEVLVLIGLVLVHEEQQRATIRDVARKTGRSVATTHRHLRGLRRKGWVFWHEGLTATLQSAVRRTGYGPDTL